MCQCPQSHLQGHHVTHEAVIAYMQYGLFAHLAQAHHTLPSAPKTRPQLVKLYELCEAGSATRTVVQISLILMSRVQPTCPCTIQSFQQHTIRAQYPPQRTETPQHTTPQHSTGQVCGGKDCVRCGVCRTSCWCCQVLLWVFFRIGLNGSVRVPH